TQKCGTKKQKHAQCQHTPLVMPEYRMRVKGKLQHPEKSSGGPNSKKLQQNLSINLPLEFRQPLETEINGVDPANPAELGMVRLYLHIGVGCREPDKKIKLLLAIKPFLLASTFEKVTIGPLTIQDAIMGRFERNLFPQFSKQCLQGGLIFSDASLGEL